MNFTKTKKVVCVSITYWSRQKILYSHPINSNRTEKKLALKKKRKILLRWWWRSSLVLAVSSDNGFAIQNPSDVCSRVNKNIESQYQFKIIILWSWKKSLLINNYLDKVGRWSKKCLFLAMLRYVGSHQRSHKGHNYVNVAYLRFKKVCSP